MDCYLYFSYIPIKEAIGPGQAQGLRAVFGAVLWHAGIIHDAMACSAYLRFKKQTSVTRSSKSLDCTCSRVGSSFDQGNAATDSVVFPSKPDLMTFKSVTDLHDEYPNKSTTDL